MNELQYSLNCSDHTLLYSCTHDDSVIHMTIYAEAICDKTYYVLYCVPFSIVSLMSEQTVGDCELQDIAHNAIEDRMLHVYRV